MALFNHEVQVLFTCVIFSNEKIHVYGIWNLHWKKFNNLWSYDIRLNMARFNGQVQVLFTYVRFSNEKRHGYGI